jgi:hypothetical protein
MTYAQIALRDAASRMKTTAARILKVEAQKVSGRPLLLRLLRHIAIKFDGNAYSALSFGKQDE